METKFITLHVLTQDIRKLDGTALSGIKSFRRQESLSMLVLLLLQFTIVRIKMKSVTQVCKVD